jgi:hypothetical protein
MLPTSCRQMDTADNQVIFPGIPDQILMENFMEEHTPLLGYHTHSIIIDLIDHGSSSSSIS